MNLYELMKECAETSGCAPAEDLPHPELGKSLALWHACLVEAGLPQDETPRGPRLTAEPSLITPTLLSRFIVGFLPFNSVSTKEEMNLILFELYSFLRWLEKRDLNHGLEGVDFQSMVKELTSAQERCLQLSHYLDDETGRTLEEPPPIVDTLSGMFSVVKIEDDFLYLKGNQLDETVRIKLPSPILNLVRVQDHLDLVLGDTSDRWIILEAGQVFPEYQAS